MSRGPGEDETDRPSVREEIVGEALPSSEAAGLLGVKVATLYAYTSRGLIRSLPGDRGPARRYLRADLERLRARRDARRGGPPARSGVLRFGEPVLDSSITWFGPEGPIYRGHPAAHLAGEQSFEAVAELLWLGSLPPASPRWPVEPQTWSAALRAMLPRDAHPLAWIASALPLRGAVSQARFDTRSEAVTEAARRLHRDLVVAVALSQDPSRVGAVEAAPDAASAVSRALGARAERAVERALESALVLLADHELNASTFAARVAASTGADLFACLQAGVSALSGPLHGTASEGVARLLEEAGSPSGAERAIRDRLRRGERIPGFGHRLYAEADPRCAPLFARAEALAPDHPDLRTALAVRDAMGEARYPEPNVDFALVALGIATGVPAAGLPALFALGRFAGWTAHVLEQYAEGSLLRPRARFRG